MMPLHSILVRLNRCPCCRSKFSRCKSRKHGKSASRQKVKRDIQKALQEPKE